MPPRPLGDPCILAPPHGQGTEQNPNVTATRVSLCTGPPLLLRLTHDACACTPFRKQRPQPRGTQPSHWRARVTPRCPGTDRTWDWPDGTRGHGTDPLLAMALPSAGSQPKRPASVTPLLAAHVSVGTLVCARGPTSQPPSHRLPRGRARDQHLDTARGQKGQHARRGAGAQRPALQPACSHRGFQCLRPPPGLPRTQDTGH